MTTLVVPPLDDEPWPSLGRQVCDFIEESLVYGPGDLRGEPAVVDPETRGLIYRAYEVYPPGHPQAGRRRFKRVAFSVRKGIGKTEKGAWIAAAELHPDGPVRCDGFDANGEPVGVGVRDPYIPLVAYTEEQTEELGYGALYAILSEGPLANDFDIGLERITRIDGTGRAVALSGAPGARDGARTTFQWFDETHRMVLERLVNAHTTMLNNVPKRRLADAWTLETTTAFAPGQQSIAEDTWAYAESVKKGDIDDPRLFFFHRQAKDDHDLSSEEGVRAAVIEASGPAAEWSDIDSIVALRQDPRVDLAYWERVWLNRPTQDARQAFSSARWAELAMKRWRRPGRGSRITIGVDGARFRDALAMIGTEVKTGRQFVIGIHERPETAEEGYEHPAEEIDAEMRTAFEDYSVWRVYIDPQWIDHLVTRWAQRWGDRIFTWETHRHRPVAKAIASFSSAIVGGDLHHDGDPMFAAHIGNARRRMLRELDDEGQPLWVIEKERPDSPKKIDAAMAAILSWQARGDAMSSGAAQSPVPLIAVL